MRRNRSRFSAARAATVRRVLSRLGERAAIFADLVGRERIDIGEALPNQRLGELIERLVVIRRIKFPLIPFEAEPAHVVFDGINIFDILFDRVGVVESQIAVAAELGGDAEVEADRLGVPDVQVAVGFGREAGDDAGRRSSRRPTSAATISRMKSCGADDAGAMSLSSGIYA